MDETSQPKPLSPEDRIGVAVGIILSLVTCGFYNVYWNYVQFRSLNTLLGREEFEFAKWLILSIITCGLFHLYYEYKMGRELQLWLSEHGYPVSPNLGVLGLVLSCFGLSVVADAVYQHELNRLIP